MPAVAVMHICQAIWDVMPLSQPTSGCQAIQEDISQFLHTKFKSIRTLTVLGAGSGGAPSVAGPNRKAPISCQLVASYSTPAARGRPSGAARRKQHHGRS
jgi:hypothetical protein